MNSIKNQVLLIGNLGKNPELKTFSNDQKMVRLALATNESYKDQNGDRQSITQWHNVIAWGKLAENISLIVEKGNEIAIQGKLTYRTYKDPEGKDKYVTEVVAQEFLKISKKID